MSCCRPGGASPGLGRVAEQLGLTTPYLVCSNGAVTVRLHGENGRADRHVEMVDMVTFDAGPVLRLVLARLPDALVAVEELGVGYRVNAPFPPGELVGEISVEPLERLIADPVTRVILRQPSDRGRGLPRRGRADRAARASRTTSATPPGSTSRPKG